MSKDTGGPAFPNAEINTQRGGHSVFVGSWPGMTLRDWFAGQALHNMLQSGVKPAGTVAAQYAYEFADAMIAERSKP